MAGASRRSIRAHSEWNVEIHMPEPSPPTSFCDTRPHLPGGLVRERHRKHSVGPSGTLPTTMCAIRWAMTRVLPEPAPASMSTAPSVW